MIIFHNREHSEAELALDENLRFKAAIRCNNSLGQWASQKLGLSGSAAETYAKDLVSRYLQDPDSDGIFKKIRSDFDIHGIVQSDHQIRRAIDEFMMRALEDLKIKS